MLKMTLILYLTDKSADELMEIYIKPQLAQKLAMEILPHCKITIDKDYLFTIIKSEITILKKRETND
jgi:hypothetical protein